MRCHPYQQNRLILDKNTRTTKRRKAIQDKQRKAIKKSHTAMKALRGPILQVDVNHSAKAQDILVQTISEWNTVLAIVSEPYRVPDHPN